METNKTKLKCVDVIAPIEKFLRFTGVWPVKIFTRNYTLRMAISWAFSFVFLGTMCIEIIHVMGDIKRMNEVFCTLTPVSVHCCKLIALYYYRKNFFNILDILSSERFNYEGEGMDRSLQDIMQTTNKATKFFQMLTVIVVIFYTIFPFFDEKDLPVPFSFSIGRYKYAMHFFQVVSLTLCSWNLISIDLLFVILMGLASAMIDTLREKLINVISDAEKLINVISDAAKLRNENFHFKTSSMEMRVEKAVTKILHDCVLFHITILKYIRNIEAIFSFSLLIHYTTGIVLICSSLLQLTTMVDTNSIQFILSCMFIFIVLVQFSLYHWFGNEVMIKSNKISEACYTSEWYRYNVEARKIILMLMTGSKKPLGVTVYKFTMVSLSSFLTIIRWSYSFTALIRTRYISK